MRKSTELRFTLSMLAALIALLGVADVRAARGGDDASAWPRATPTATPLLDEPELGQPAGLACAGDCGGNGRVTIDELVVGVAIALGRRPVADCRSLDTNGDGRVSVGELVTGVSRLLLGCNGVAPTRTPTPPGVQSVCGGPITSAPKLCNLQISPTRVRRGGNVTVSFGVSDLEGDLTTLCAGVGPDDGAAPTLNCTTADPAGMTINAAGDVGPLPVNLAIGHYVFGLQFRDQAGHASPLLTVRFEVFNVRM